MRLFLMTAAAVAIAPMGLAFAQDAPADRVEIIVTAPGPDRGADELVGPAVAIDREEIVERLAGSLGDTLDSVPGVATTFFGQGASRPVLRGLGAERVQVLTNGIGVIDASAASPDHQVSADGIDAKAIEILRGPAALAYGGQAIGGVVNVIDGLIAEEAPERAFGGEAFTAYNSVNEGSELGGRASGALGPFVLTLTGSRRDFDDFEIPDFAESAALRAEEAAEGEAHEEEAGGTAENSFVETETLAAGLSYVGERGFLGVAVRRQEALYGLPGHSEEGHAEEESAEEPEEEAEESPFIDLEQTRVDLRGGVSFDQGFLTDIIASLAIADYTHTEFEAPGEAGTVFETDGVEGRIELDHAIADFEGAFGLQFIDKEISAVGDEAFITPTTTESFGVFLYETRDWANGFGIEGGLRFDTVELDNINQGSASFDLISASAGAHRHFANGWFFGAQLSYTERAPSESELFADGPHLATGQFEVGDRTLGKESGLNLEGAARWRGDNAGFGVNLFVTDFSDFTFLTPGTTVEDGEVVDEADGLPVFVFVQEDARFVGGEIYADWELDNGPLAADWELRASLDFVDAERDGGGNLPLIPPLSFTAGASAEWGAFELGAEVTRAAEQDEPGEGELPTDGYTRLDLRGEVDLSDFGLGRDGTEAFIEARNVTDEEIRYATSVLKDLLPAPGRNIRAGIRVAF